MMSKGPSFNLKILQQPPNTTDAPIGLLMAVSSYLKSCIPGDCEEIEIHLHLVDGGIIVDDVLISVDNSSAEEAVSETESIPVLCSLGRRLLTWVRKTFARRTMSKDLDVSEGNITSNVLLDSVSQEIVPENSTRLTSDSNPSSAKTVCAPTDTVVTAGCLHLSPGVAVRKVRSDNGIFYGKSTEEGTDVAITRVRVSSDSAVTTKCVDKRTAVDIRRVISDVGIFYRKPTEEGPGVTISGKLDDTSNTLRVETESMRDVAASGNTIHNNDVTLPPRCSIRYHTRQQQQRH